MSPVIDGEKAVTTILLAYTSPDLQKVLPLYIKQQIQTHFHFIHTTLCTMLT